MERTRAYRRSLRNRAITRKKATVKNFTVGALEWYSADGKYSKGKIHCSCCMCREKDYRGKHILTKAESLSIRNYNEAKRLYEGAEVTALFAS